MQPVLIVEAEVAAQGLAQRRVLIEAHFVEAFEFEGVEEGFHVGVVIHGARTIHALNEAMFAERLFVQARAVFDAAIGMEEDAGGRFTQADGPLQGGDGEGGGAALAQGPADDAPREAIHDHGKVAPLTGDLEVSDIADPELVDALDVLAAHYVVDGAEELQRLALAAEQVVTTALQSYLAHEASDTAATYDVASLAQGFGDAWAAVAVAGAGVGQGDELDHGGVAAMASAQGTLLPGIEAGARDAISLAHHLDAERLTVCLDESEDLRFRAEANRMAFFRRSCSS